MTTDGLMPELVRFFKAARHLWGRCPSCGEPFRLSDAKISSSPEPPRDWLRKLERDQANLELEGQRLDEMSESLEFREEELGQVERELRDREKNLTKNAKQLANEMLKTDSVLNARIKDAQKAAIMRSRSVLLGKLLECIAPCFRRFGHDPHDMRPILNPVDYILFDGLTADRKVQEIAFIEVKCGTSKLSPTQRSLREAVDRRRVHWETWTVGDPRIPIEQQLSDAKRGNGAARVVRNPFS